jgi:tetratricopeptide (TPR) repeat protein
MTRVSNPLKRLRREVKAKLARGEELQDGGELRVARKLFDEVLALDLPDDLRGYAYAARADVRDDEDDFEGAIADYTAAIAIDPGDPVLYYLRSIVHSGRADWRATRDDLDAAFAHELDMPEAYELRGMAHYNLADYELARADFARAIDGNPDVDPKWLVYRGIAALLLERPADAIGDFTDALQRDRDNAKALAQRAKAYEACGRFGEAFADLTRVAELVPPDPALDADLERLRGRLR